jgi:prevent-host-death family protein
MYISGMARRISISEARRLLPQLVREVAAEGGRVDITYRGKPQVSLLRVGDVKGSRDPVDRRHSDALKVELTLPPEELIDMIHEIRQAHVPRTAWLTAVAEAPRRVKPRVRKQRKRVVAK